MTDVSCVSLPRKQKPAWHGPITRIQLNIHQWVLFLRAHGTCLKPPVSLPTKLGVTQPDFLDISKEKVSRITTSISKQLVSSVLLSTLKTIYKTQSVSASLQITIQGKPMQMSCYFVNSLKRSAIQAPLCKTVHRKMEKNHTTRHVKISFLH